MENVDGHYMRNCGRVRLVARRINIQYWHGRSPLSIHYRIQTCACDYSRLLRDPRGKYLHFRCGIDAAFTMPSHHDERSPDWCTAVPFCESGPPLRVRRTTCCTRFCVNEQPRSETHLQETYGRYSVLARLELHQPESSRLIVSQAWPLLQVALFTGTPDHVAQCSSISLTWTSLLIATFIRARCMELNQS